MSNSEKTFRLLSLASVVLFVAGLVVIHPAGATAAVETVTYHAAGLGCNVVAEGKNTGVTPGWVFVVVVAGPCPFSTVTPDVCTDTNPADSVTTGFMATCVINPSATFRAEGVGPTGLGTPSLLTMNAQYEYGFGCAPVPNAGGNPLCPSQTGPVTWTV